MNRFHPIDAFRFQEKASRSIIPIVRNNENEEGSRSAFRSYLEAGVLRIYRVFPSHFHFFFFIMSRPQVFSAEGVSELRAKLHAIVAKGKSHAWSCCCVCKIVGGIEVSPEVHQCTYVNLDGPDGDGPDGDGDGGDDGHGDDPCELKGVPLSDFKALAAAAKDLIALIEVASTPAS